MIKIVQIMLISKVDCFARDYILFSKFLEVSEVFQSFACEFKSKPLRMQSRLTSDKQWGAKYQTEMLLRIAKQQFKSRGHITFKVSSEKNTLTEETDDQTFNCDNVNQHWQTGNLKKIGK